MYDGRRRDASARGGDPDAGALQKCSSPHAASPPWFHPFTMPDCSSGIAAMRQTSPAGSGEYRSCRSSRKKTPELPGRERSVIKPLVIASRTASVVARLQLNTDAKHNESHSTGTDDPPGRPSMK